MEFGSKIKDLRLQCGLTQEELGDRCDLTKGYISQLENDNTSPSIATLKDILSACGSSLKSFFSDDEDDKIVFGANDFFTKETNQEKIVWLVPNSQKNMMEPILTTIMPQTILYEDFPHEGEEFGYVFKGKIELYVGKRHFTVKSGESFYFTADKKHYIENKTDTLAKIIWVSTPPSF